jgi:Mn-dependent DtxR family transcriptional regulator
VKDTEQARNEDNKYVELERQVLKIIDDSALDGKRIMSVDELASSFEGVDPFMLKMQILTLEGKGLVKKTDRGYILTEKGKERLQNKN